MKQIDGGITAVPGLRATGVHAGLKPDNEKDVALIAADAPAVAAGVFTKNRVCAPVVLVCRENLSDNTGQAIIVNSKNANACTGEIGMKNARQMASLVGEALGIDPSLVLVASTGVIGQQLPMDKITNGIRLAAPALEPDGGHDAALAIMTTDTVPKEIAVEFEIGGKTARIGGMTKGAGMIAPNLATMLAFLATNVNIASGPLQQALRESAAKSFNRMTIDTDSMASLVGEALGIDPSLVLVASTGVIGQQLPMDKITNGIRLAAPALEPDGGHDAALAIMTTDTVPKEIAVEFEIGGKTARIGGMTKGAGMIAPNLATMLAFLATNVNIAREPLQQALRESAAKSFNRMTIDTDSSTNDTVLILATGTAGNPEITETTDDDYEAFREGLDFACIELAKKIARDGEGATKLVEVVVNGAKNETEGEMAARAIAESPLVKTAVFGADANWGRIMMAVGKSGADFDPYQVNVWLSNYQLVKDGMDAGFDEDKATELFSKDTVTITVDLNAGDATVTMWTCDYSYDYIKINADYRT